MNNLLAVTNVVKIVKLNNLCTKNIKCYVGCTIMMCYLFYDKAVNTAVFV